MTANGSAPSNSSSCSKGGVVGEFSVYVGNLAPETPLADLEELLYELFLQAGPLTRVHIPFSKDTGKHKCYGFVEFQHLESVPYAILLMHGIRLCGRAMNIKRVTPPSNQQSATPTETTATVTTTTTPPNPFFAALQAGLPPPPLPLAQTTPHEGTPTTFPSPHLLPPPPMVPPPPDLGLTPPIAPPIPLHPPDGSLPPMFLFPLPPTPPHFLPSVPPPPHPLFTPLNAPPRPLESPFSQPPPFPVLLSNNQPVHTQPPPFPVPMPTDQQIPVQPPPFPVSMTTDEQIHVQPPPFPVPMTTDEQIHVQPPPFPVSMTTEPQVHRDDFLQPRPHLDIEPMEQQHDELPLSPDPTHACLHTARLEAHNRPKWLRDDVQQLISLYHLQQLGKTFKKLREAMGEGPPQIEESGYR